MKKVLVTILAILYLYSSVGATVHLHYCMDKLVSWGLGQNKSGKKPCSFCGMAKKESGKACTKPTKGCCKDEQKFVKNEKDQKATIFEYSFNKQVDELTSYPIELASANHIFSAILENPTSHAPPFKEKIPTFIRNCVFRI